jgi:hypothetical protein
MLASYHVNVLDDGQTEFHVHIFIYRTTCLSGTMVSFSAALGADLQDITFAKMHFEVTSA